MDELPSFRSAVRLAWNDTLTVFARLPRFALISFLIIFIAEMGREFLTLDGFGGKIVDELFTAPGNLFTVPFAIAATRLIVLNEVPSHFMASLHTERFRRFFSWAVGLWAIFTFPSIAMEMRPASSVTEVVGWISVIIVGAYFVLRLALLFPAIAVDAKGATAANAFIDSNKRFWLLLRSAIIAAIPSLIFAFAIVVIALVDDLGNITDLDGGWKVLHAGIASALQLLTIALQSVTFARAFEWIGQRVKYN